MVGAHNSSSSGRKELDAALLPRWMFVSLAAVLLLLVAAGAWYYRTERAAAHQKAIDQLSSIASLKLDQLSMWRRSQLSDALELTESPFLAEGVARYLEAPAGEAADALLKRFRSIQRERDYANVLLLDPQGQVRLSLNGIARGDAELSAALSEALRTKTPAILDLHIGPSHSWPALGVVTPILAPDGQAPPPIGAIALVSDATQFLYPLINSWPTPSQTAETLLVRRDGDTALFLNNVRHQPDTALRLRIPLSQSELPAVRAVLGETGVVEGTDYRGTSVLSVLLPVPNSPWFMVAKVDAAEVFSDWRSRATLIFLLFTGLMGATVAIGLVARQRGEKRLYKALYISEAALRVAVERHSAALQATEAERAKLQAQLMEARRMESVGRLAGGIAHDFNNMLSVILGYTELALDKLDPSAPLHADLLEVQTVAQRSTDLTRQLLAFARKQTIAPRVLDLNETVESLLTMLRRLIGEDITLDWRPRAGLWPIRMDPGQINQILTNLCANARDAIASTGRITLETSCATLDDAYCTEHPGSLAGEFVQLTVSDDGVGIGKELIDHLFEPFFTTKRPGAGTGLGLATVYGIVKQNDGFINVYSEPGHGTAFTIYLPRHVGPAEAAAPGEPAARVRAGHGTVLLVEDEPAVLRMTSMGLTSLGYQVLAAATPEEAIRLARTHAGRIDVLLTDVVMPEMNGPDLARQLQSLQRGLLCVFMSGYTADVIAQRGVLDEGMLFIQKPFSMKALAAKMEEALARR